MLKILLICPWLPWPPFDGARIRILETLRYLSTRHQVSLLANARSRDEKENVRAMAGLCRYIEVEYLPTSTRHRLGRMTKGLFKGSSLIQSFHFNEALARRISTITSEEEFDIVQIELSFLARYASAISPASKAVKVLSTHNIETQRMRRELRLSSWSDRRLVLLGDSIMFPFWEGHAVGRFDGAIAVSASDQKWIQRYLKQKPVQLVPNGVDIEYFRPGKSTNGDRQSIVFTGLMDYPPNVDAVCWFVKEIFPSIRKRYPALQFDIVGARPTARVLALVEHDGVRVTGEVPDIRPYVNEAVAFVVPLRSGGGTRLKILQAMSMACPVISTAMGAEGLQVEDGNNILIAENAHEFTAKIEGLVASSGDGKRIGEAGRELVTAQYDWKSCLEGVETLYRQVLGQESL